MRADDWPQWRGPNRNGVVSNSPPLIEAIGDRSPKRVWESETIPGGNLGGYGQAVVADDRVFVLVHERKDAPRKERVLTRDALTRLGWFPDLPRQLTAAVEEARTSDARTRRTEQKEILTWADEWLRTNLKPEWGKFHQAMRMRLVLGPKALPLDLLGRLEPAVDRDFADEAALVRFLDEQGFDEPARRQVLDAVPKTQRSAVDWMYALDRETGKTIWKKEFPGKWMISPNSSTPLVAEGRCYFLGSGGMIRCLAVGDGTFLWESALLVKVVQQHSRSSSPMVAGGLLVICTDEALQALDARTGALTWSVAQVQNREASPVLWRAEGKDCVLCAGTGHLFCLELVTGKILWSVPAGSSASTPAVSGNIMVFSGGRKDPGLTAYSLSFEAPTRLWNVPFIDPFMSAAILGKYVYAIGGGCGVMQFGEKGKGKALCVELETGKVVWEEIIGPPHFSSPVIADGKILAEVEGALLLLRASPEGYQFLGKADLKLAKWITPAIADGRLYLRTTENVVCYDLRKRYE